MPRDSTSIILHRHEPELQVFLVLRSPDLKFFGGYHAFAGGRMEPGDELVPLAAAGSMSTSRRASIGCGVRELFEETGILTIPEPGLDADLATELRERLIDGGDGTELVSALRERGLEVDASRWIEAARLITPRFSRIRFDTRLYFVSTSQEPEIRAGELVSGSWWKPGDALDAWRRGEIHLSPLALVVLRALENHPTIASAAAELREIPPRFEGSGHAIPWGPGTDLVPLRSRPLPASIPTTTFIVGEKCVLVVDPAPGDADEQDHLLRAVGTRVERGHRLEAIVLTHHHVDHVGAVGKLQERFGLPVWAHPRTGDLLERRLDRELVDGATIRLGASPDRRDGWTLRCLFTPGHAEGHLALWDERHRALIAGDLLSTLVSMYVGSPGGHLGTYFRSLERIRRLDMRILYPSHGPPTVTPVDLIDRTLAHRVRRVEQIHGVLARGPGEVTEIAGRVYGEETDSRLRPLYERTTRAALVYLVENERARRVGEDCFEAI